MKRSFHLAGVALMFLALTLEAARTKRGWTKVEIRTTQGRLDAAAARWLARAGGEVIADYGTFVIATVPEGGTEAFARGGNARGFQVRSRDDLDTLHLPNASFDVHAGPADAKPGETISGYPRGTKGYFVIQLAGLGRSEWLQRLDAIGWKLGSSVPSNGFIAIGKPEWMAKTRALPYVQYLDVFQPNQKYWDLSPARPARSSSWCRKGSRSECNPRDRTRG
jgi:hypothetical protein